MESVNVLTSMAEDKSSLDSVELATRAVDPVAWRERVFARLQSFNDFAAETSVKLGPLESGSPYCDSINVD